MEKLTKRQIAREEAFKLLFEREFHPEKTVEEIYNDALSARAFKADPYIFATFSGTVQNLDAINADIDKHAVGWKRNRISPVSLAVLELCIYEMRFCTDIPLKVSLNEAIELTKRYDDEKARAFVNGILNAVMKEAEQDRDEE